MYSRSSPSPSASPVVGELTGGIELPALDVHDDRHREELHEREMLLLDQLQAGLGLDLGVVQRSPCERDRGALPVDEALPRRVPLATRPLQSEVEQSKRELIALRDPQRCADARKPAFVTADGGKPPASAASTASAAACAGSPWINCSRAVWISATASNPG